MVICMLRSVAAVAALSVGLLGVGTARAQTPFGGDDTGFVPPAANAKCEAGAGKAVDKLIACILKCHASRASGKLADDTAEDSCEKTLVGKSCAALFTASIAKLTGCPACINGTTMANLAGLTETVLDGMNSSIYCGTPAPTFAHLATTNLPGTSNCGGAGLSPGPSAPLGGAIFSDTACTTKLSDLGLACLDIGGGNAVTVPPGPVVDGASNVFDIAADQTTLLASAGTSQFNCTKGAGPG